MFTGLVEITGSFGRLARGSGRTARLALRVPVPFGPVKVGDSVAVNGVCLTAVKVDTGTLEMDVLDETLARTNLGGLRVGERVNLERSLTPSSQLGGHLVTGHVDDIGTVLQRRRAGGPAASAGRPAASAGGPAATAGGDWVFEIGVDAKYMPFIAPKGSIAVDGISLTVVETSPAGEAGAFTVHIIPYTFDQTTLGDRVVGGRVNIEVDLMARYIANFIRRSRPEPVEGERQITRDFLAEHGFA